MPKYYLDSDSILSKRGKNNAFVIKKDAFEAFNPNVLGLGDIKQESEPISTIASIFDLQGFTNFCRQIEPHLSIPIFLNGFLDWIFEAIRKEMVHTEDEVAKSVVLFHHLPFFVKFMGDGILFLWNTETMGSISQHNLILSLVEICKRYESEFLPKMRKKVVDTPPKLRCGIAKGTVYSVGNGEDYIGSCINMASRLQKLHGLRFAFSRRGFDPETEWDTEELEDWLLKSTSIRGIGDGELIYVRKRDFDTLRPEDKARFTSIT